MQMNEFYDLESTSGNTYEMLGDEVGVDWGSAIGPLFSGAGEIAQGIYKGATAKSDEETKKAAAAALAAVHPAAPVPAAPPPPPPPKEEASFFTKMHAGVPTWGWLMGGTAILGGVALMLRSRRKR